jgi:hypothetical protein
MADQGFKRGRRFFRIHGVDVNSPIDATKRQSRAYRLKNMTVDIDGSITPRPGLASLYGGALVVAGQTPCHTVRRISDDDNGLWARIIGTGTHLAVELSSAPGVTNSIDSGYSGSPFTTAAWRPTESAKLHLYIGDDTRMRKVDVAGVDKQIGLPAPINPPTVELAQPRYKTISEMQVVAATWAQGGMAGIPVLLAGGRINTTLEVVSGAIYDSGATGWACFRPVNLSNIGVGSIVDIWNGFEQDYDTRVQEVHRAGTATTISSIAYESGTAGVCVIQPTNPVLEFRRNAVVKLVNGGTTEYQRILAVMRGVNGGMAIRLSTTTNFVAGNDLQVVNSFRAYTGGGYAALGAVVDQKAVESTSTAAGVMTLTSTVAVDMTSLDTFTPTQTPATDEDYLSMSFRSSSLSQVTNVRVMFSLDGTFTENFFYRTFERNVLVAAAENTQTMTEIQRRIRQTPGAGAGSNPYARRGSYHRGNRARDMAGDIFGGGFRGGDAGYEPADVDPPVPAAPTPDVPSGETGVGNNQWSELRWRRGDCLRSGTNESLGWKDVAAVRIEATVVAGAVVILFNSLNISGGGELDMGIGDSLNEPYVYRYRGRDSTTGVVSDYSPECLEQIMPYRDRTIITLPTLTATEIDKIDIERYGGSQSQWLLVGTVANGTATYTDNLNDEAAIISAPRSDYRLLQPWVRFGAPVSGTATTVAGNLVVSSTAISTSIAPGTPITVNGIATFIRRIIGAGTTSSRWELVHSIGAATNAAWEIPVQVLVGQPLGAIWRHDANGLGVMFACDGPFIRWSIANNPDGTRSSHYLEMTESNDPTVMGFSHGGNCGVFTTERLFWIKGDPENGFRAVQVPDTPGLFSRYAIAANKLRLAWLSKSRLNTSLGAGPEQGVEQDDLAPLFADEEGGRAVTSVNGVKAPYIISTEADHLRLDHGDDGSVFFFYRDSVAARACLRYMPTVDAWRPYEYAKALTSVYSEEGTGLRSLLGCGADGKLYQVGGSANPVTDDGTGFAWEMQTFAEDFGDARAVKKVGDFEVDADAGAGTINVELGYNNHGSTATLNSTTITGARQQKVFDISSGDGVLARNVSLKLSGTTAAGARPRMYSWEPSYQELPADTILRAAKWHDGGYAGDKYMQAVIIHANTYNQVKALRIEKDGGTLIDTISIQHNGERRETYAFDVTSDALRTARLLRIATTDSDPWHLIDWEWVFNREPPAAKVWEIQYTGVDTSDYFHVFQILLALASSASTTMETFADGTLIATNTIASTSGVIAKTTPIVLPAKKAKLIKWRLESTADLRLYRRDCAIWTMQYGGGDYAMLRPFGDDHRDQGARA